MSALIQFVFSVEGVIAALAVGTAWVVRRPQSLAPRRFLLFVTVLYVLTSIYIVPAGIGRLLTYGYRPFVADTGAGAVATAIVVLGSGAETVHGWNGGRAGVPGGESAARALEAARIARQLPAAVVISSGGPPPNEREIPVALVMRDYLVSLGIQRSRVLVETESRDTHDEATVLDPLMRARGIREIVLVTSDVHMRRSVGTFERFGWTVVPAIAPNPNFDKPLARRMVPSSMGLVYSSAVAHELIGIPYYWLRGWWR
jgi:uncharacterized SAM-binding protein YcdF (DUF218 family)